MKMVFEDPEKLTLEETQSIIQYLDEQDREWAELSRKNSSGDKDFWETLNEGIDILEASPEARRLFMVIPPIAVDANGNDLFDGDRAKCIAKEAWYFGQTFEVHKVSDEDEIPRSLKGQRNLVSARMLLDESVPMPYFSEKDYVLRADRELLVIRD